MMYNAPLVLSVSQLNRYVKSRMDADENLFNVFLVGEISNFTDHYKTGHFYFSLKDEEGFILSSDSCFNGALPAAFRSPTATVQCSSFLYVPAWRRFCA